MLSYVPSKKEQKRMSKFLNKIWTQPYMDKREQRKQDIMQLRAILIEHSIGIDTSRCSEPFLK